MLFAYKSSVFSTANALSLQRKHLKNKLEVEHEVNIIRIFEYNYNVQNCNRFGRNEITSLKKFTLSRSTLYWSSPTKNLLCEPYMSLSLAYKRSAIWLVEKIRYLIGRKEYNNDRIVCSVSILHSLTKNNTRIL